MEKVVTTDQPGVVVEGRGGRGVLLPGQQCLQGVLGLGPLVQGAQQGPQGVRGVAPPGLLAPQVTPQAKAPQQRVRPPELLEVGGRLLLLLLLLLHRQQVLLVLLG